MPRPCADGDAVSPVRQARERRHKALAERVERAQSRLDIGPGPRSRLQVIQTIQGLDWLETRVAMGYRDARRGLAESLWRLRREARRLERGAHP